MERADLSETLRVRAETFHTLVDGDIALSITQTAEGRTYRSPTLSGVVAFDRDRPALWLRAEKIGRQIFTLKARGDRFNLALPETQEVVTGGPAAYAKLPHLIRPAEVRYMLAGPDTLGLSWTETTMEVDSKYYRFDVRVLGSRYAQVLVDRKKCAIAAITRYDAAGHKITEVHMSGYKPLGGILFPRRFVIDRPRQQTSVKLRLGRPKLNKPIPDAAFQAPERPGWRPVNLDRQPLDAVQAFRKG